jgi:hypothetical protein
MAERKLWFPLRRQGVENSHREDFNNLFIIRRLEILTRETDRLPEADVGIP